jgi:UDP-glucose 4-epimerase
VVVIDNLSSGSEENLHPDAVLIRKDIRTNLKPELEGVEALFHMAADPDVRGSAANPRTSFDNNVEGTYDVLESCRKAEVERVVFASTSTVYGDAEKIPTPEDHHCVPISNYAASKLAGEAYLASYCSSYGLKGTSLRYANIFGERGFHGVMHDFFHKLHKNPDELEILGDGNQDKSYLYVSDCVSATMAAWQKQEGMYDYFNVGSGEKTKVKDLAKMMCEILELDPKFEFTGTPRGWVGDVRLMQLDTSKLEALGWEPKVKFKQGMERYLKWLSGWHK